ncbi:MAG: hypothetical protein COB30_012740 [Ectothiorhodospiraceae bacterium]|nr:hypothetical protein [Ectothiorhodospiraceae bacterium]
MFILGFLSKLMMAAGLIGYIYGWFKSEKMIKIISLVVLASGVVFWVVKEAVGITFIVLILALIIGGMVYALKKSGNKSGNNTDEDS